MRCRRRGRRFCGGSRRTLLLPLVPCYRLCRPEAWRTCLRRSCCGEMPWFGSRHFRLLCWNPSGDLPPSLSPWLYLKVLELYIFPFLDAPSIFLTLDFLSVRRLAAIELQHGCSLKQNVAPVSQVAVARPCWTVNSWNVFWLKQPRTAEGRCRHGVWLREWVRKTFYKTWMWRGTRAARNTGIRLNWN